MSKRFGVRKIKIGSYSRQGWLLSERESFVVFDRKWRETAKQCGCAEWEWGIKRYKYIEYTAWNNKDFVKAIADYLNETIGDDVTKYIDGYRAYNAVLVRDLGSSKFGCYREWCDKFSTGFRPTEKFQKV